MYMAAVLAVVMIIWIIGVMMAGGWGVLSMMWDSPSFVMILVMGGAVVAAAGFWKDFLNAFRLAMGKRRQVGLTEWKRAKEAVELFSRALRYGSFFIALLQFTAVSAVTMNEPQVQWITLVMAALPLLYAYAVNILLLPIKGRIAINMIEYMQKPGESDEITEEGSR